MKKQVEKQLHIIGSTTNSRTKHRSNRFFSEDEFRNSEKDFTRRINREKPRTEPQQKQRKQEERPAGFLDLVLAKRKPILIIAAVVACVLIALIVINSNKKEIVKGIMKSELGASVADTMVGESYSKNVWDSGFNRDRIVINNGVSTPEDYKVIALFGIDAREDDLKAGSRSDSMIVLSFNEKTGDVKMGSVFRDTYLVDDCNENNEYYIGKANAAYMIGGPELAINMLNRNWDLAVTDYVVVNFAGLSNIIDAMGGVTLKVTDEEIKEINYHMKGQIDAFGGEYVELKEAGEVRMNGAQATTFCRIRSVDFVSPLDGQTYSIDFGRTARQRYALNQLFKEAKDAGVSKLISVINEVCENNVGDNKFIMTSLPLDETMKLLSGFMDMNISGQDAFPHTDRSYITMLDSGSTVVADTLEENAKLFHAFLFGQEDYSLSDDFYKYNSWITRWVNLQKTGNADVAFDPNAPVTEIVTEEVIQEEEYYETLPYEYISEDTEYEYYEAINEGYAAEGIEENPYTEAYNGDSYEGMNDAGQNAGEGSQEIGAGEGSGQEAGAGEGGGADTGITDDTAAGQTDNNVDNGDVNHTDTGYSDGTDTGFSGDTGQSDAGTGGQEIPQEQDNQNIDSAPVQEPDAGQSADTEG